MLDSCEDGYSNVVKPKFHYLLFIQHAHQSKFNMNYNKTSLRIHCTPFPVTFMGTFKVLLLFTFCFIIVSSISTTSPTVTIWDLRTCCRRISQSCSSFTSCSKSGQGRGGGLVYVGDGGISADWTIAADSALITDSACMCSRTVELKQKQIFAKMSFFILKFKYVSGFQASFSCFTLNFKF